MGAFESMNLVRHSNLAVVDRVEVCNNISSANSDRSWTVQRVRGPEFENRSCLHVVHYTVFLCYSVQSHALPCANFPKDLTKCGKESLFQN